MVNVISQITFGIFGCIMISIVILAWVKTRVRGKVKGTEIGYRIQKRVTSLNKPWEFDNFCKELHEIIIKYKEAIEADVSSLEIKEK